MSVTNRLLNHPRCKRGRYGRKRQKPTQKNKKWRKPKKSPIPAYSGKKTTPPQSGVKATN